MTEVCKEFLGQGPSQSEPFPFILLEGKPAANPKFHVRASSLKTKCEETKGRPDILGRIKRCDSVSSVQSDSPADEDQDGDFNLSYISTSADSTYHHNSAPILAQSGNQNNRTRENENGSRMGNNAGIGIASVFKMDEILPSFSEGVYSSLIEPESTGSRSQPNLSTGEKVRSGRTLFQLISAKIDQNKSFRSVNGSTCNKKSSSGFLPFCSPKIPQHSGSTSPAGNWICGLFRRNNSVNLSSESLAESDTKSYSKGYFRYLLLLISILCMTSTRSNELSFNFTVICMTSNSSVNNDTPISMKPRELSAAFAGGGIGAIAMVLPVVYALHYFGPRLVFASLLAWSGVATFAIPFLARISPLVMVPARIIQGLALSAVLPLMGCISAEWAPVSEIGKFMTLLSSAGQLSQILTMPLSAHLCVTSGWSSVYYTHGIISAILAVSFFLLYRSSPRKHPCVNPRELEFITQGAKAQTKKERRVPYAQIFRSKAVWAVWIAFLGNSFGFQLIVQFMPTFLNKVLNVPIAKTGMVAIIPPITQLMVKVVAGYVCDGITSISELTKLKVFNSMAMVGCGLFLLPLGYLSPSQSPGVGDGECMWTALVCFTCSISCLGMVACSSMKSATLVARTYTHFVMGVVQLVVCVGMLLVPIIVSWLAPNNAITEWRSVFFLVFMILLASDAVFCRYCSAEPASWAIASVACDAPEPLIEDDANQLTVTGAESIVKNDSNMAPASSPVDKTAHGQV
ncbi:major facilitator superfamily domain-containing protein [Ditylenchus destructor]|uniref:Major facilitator superfamily domain-containing protein n=1 Tax=Ditylenchus destructor TaxID=166010 RepID=A0AAD4N9J9_9BILA|nr:major facilitator superfamily domain-containing protein [Ditylenchus destructor]